MAWALASCSAFALASTKTLSVPLFEMPACAPSSPALANCEMTLTAAAPANAVPVPLFAAAA